MDPSLQRTFRTDELPRWLLLPIVFGYGCIVAAVYGLMLASAALRRAPPSDASEAPTKPTPVDRAWMGFWNRLPRAAKIGLSRFSFHLYHTRISRHVIGPYARLHYADPGYVNRFVSMSGEPGWRSFQDFFTRVHAAPPPLEADAVWPCTGLLCDIGGIDAIPPVSVKGERLDARSVFGRFGAEVPSGHVFANVFLHNKDYHHVHLPVTATITGLERVDGDLIFLRPWFYADPSRPAMVNGRINLRLEDEAQRPWYLSIVGGPAVNAIELPTGVRVGARLVVGEKLATFLLGSTCCVAAPLAPTARRGRNVRVFTALIATEGERPR